MLLKIVILLCGLSCTLAATVPEDTALATLPVATAPRIDERFFLGGFPTNITKCPWQVSLQYFFGLHFCGGSIYSKHIVLTSASCLQWKLPALVKIRVGSSYNGVSGLLVPVSTFAIHPDYNRFNSQADVALIRLATPLRFGQKIKPIPLATSLIEHNAIAQVSGWGAGKFKHFIPKKMWAANLTIINWNHCKSTEYGYGSKILAGMFCAAGANLKDFCKGDIGGPLVADGVLVGIVSWGLGCFSYKFPEVYSSISYYKSWITYTANQMIA